VTPARVAARKAAQRRLQKGRDDRLEIVGNTTGISTFYEI
jgi:hypothetical protein